MKDKAALALAYIAAFAAVGGGLFLLGCEFSCVEGFPLKILDEPDLWDQYLQVITGASSIISGWVFTLMLGKIQADNGRLREWEVRNTMVTEIVPLLLRQPRGG